MRDSLQPSIKESGQEDALQAEQTNAKRRDRVYLTLLFADDTCI
jgi:hypothetical protein